MNEQIVSVLSIFDARTCIAGLAFVVAVQQMWASRKHNKLSVKPLICDHTDIDSTERTFSYSLQNKGLGTAKVMAFDYLWDGMKVSEQELRAKVEGLTKQNDIVRISNMGESYAISKDEAVPIIELQINSSELSDLPDDRLDAILRRLVTCCRINIKFESLYEESFTFSTSTSAIDLDAYKPIDKQA